MREIVFFDGACGVCNGFVIRTAANDSAGRFFYAPLGGETARECGIAETDSVVVVVEGSAGDAEENGVGSEPEIYFRSKAVLYLMKHQDSKLQRGIAHAFGWIPAPLLNVFYRAFARIRHLMPTSGKTAADSSFAQRILP
jgi:predicted DCC family thiol-disulfide oxidoreductase YuxK